ncbi:MFS-type transporter SLC18B1-like, partial [Convolutriloba macropyga]|uniref:MFS-type transporter SLC18B1-like n=1 Tax=Convolutriloba macropyga TaxID=536237 RepID=UPI003F51C266
GLWFAFTCFTCRIMMGIGAGMIWSTGIPLLMSLAPAYSGRITSLIESGAGIGITIGPAIGSAAYSLGGYKFPFVTAGGIEMLMAIVVMFFTSRTTLLKISEKFWRLSRPGNCFEILGNSYVTLQDWSFYDDNDEYASVPILRTTKDSSELSRTSAQLESSIQDDQMQVTTSEASIQFLSIPGIWAVSLIFPLFGVPFGLLDVSLSPFLLEHFGVDGDTVGFYFLSLGAMYAIVTQFTGYITDKGGAAYLYFWSSNVFVMNSCLYFLPYFLPGLEQKWFIVVVVAITGFGLSGTFVPMYLLLQELALTSGYSRGLENLKLLVGIWINFLSAG